jgi:3-methyladenine DNA glycosylase AlkD
MYPLVRAVRQPLEDAADPSKSLKMQAYMKSAMPCRGVTSPEQARRWDYVDHLATHRMGDVLRAEPRRTKPLMRHMREVKRYVAANRVRLSPLSVREALKNA